MILLEPNQTPYDLNWRMFGVPVRVHPLFWLVSAILGFNALQRDGIAYLLLWIACVFVSVLVHEFGHVVMGGLFGSYGHIVLYSFGGLAIGSSDARSRWQRIAVYFAGPLAGFIFLALLVLGLFIYNPLWGSLAFQEIKYSLGLPISRGAWVDFDPPRMADAAIWNLSQINLFWGLVNLLPVWPLDGGQISRELFTWFRPRNGLRLSLGFSAAFAAFIAVNCVMAYNDRPLIPFLSMKSLFAAFLFAILAIQSFQLMQMTGASRSSWHEEESDPWSSQRAPWERDPDYWKR